MIDKKTDRIYIAGPMRGYVNYNYFRFFEVEKQLLKKGYDVINPAYESLKLAHMLKIDYTSITHEVYMEQDLKLLSKCSVVYFLNKWTESEGANEEYNYAVKNNYKLLFENMDALKNL